MDIHQRDEDQQINSDKHSEILAQLLRCSKNIERELTNRFRKQFKQSFSRFDLLSKLFQKKQTEPDNPWMPIGQVAKQLMASNGNITGLVDRMIAEGLVDRRDNLYDRRSIEICVTEKGLDLYDNMSNAYDDWSKTLLMQHLPSITQVKLNKIVS